MVWLKMSLIGYVSLTPSYNSIGSNGSLLVWYYVLSSPTSVDNSKQVITYYTFSIN